MDVGGGVCCCCCWWCSTSSSGGELEQNLTTNLLKLHIMRSFTRAPSHRHYLLLRAGNSSSIDWVDRVDGLQTKMCGVVSKYTTYLPFHNLHLHLANAHSRRTCALNSGYVHWKLSLECWLMTFEDDDDRQASIEQRRGSSPTHMS